MHKCFLILFLTLCVPAQTPVAIAGTARIPGATFEMGTDKADIPKLLQKFNAKRAELFEEETPKHRVTISSFYMDRTEVTNAQFKRFVETNESWRKDRIDPKLHNGKYLQSWNGNDYPAGTDNRPVAFVSWYAAAAYCQSQGKRLPTEAEWEFAARGGLAGKMFPWGDEMPDKTRANYSASELKSTTDVGRYPANGYGLYDMAGNVWEFLADEWQKYPLAAANVSPDFLKVTTRRALRGGSFAGSPINLRVTYRDSHAPENAAEHVGFRCAMTPAAQSGNISKDLLDLAATERAFAAETVKVGFRDGFMKYFADDGIGFGPHPERTREKLQKLPPQTGPRKVIFNWAPMFGDISSAGDLGYTTGPVLYTDTGENPRPPRHAIYFSVWQKQSDGSWRVVVDLGVDTPEAVAPVDTQFTAANPVRRSGKTVSGADDYRKLDWDFWGSIAKTNAAKAYGVWLDKQFRIHRKGMMPIVDRKDLVAPAIRQTKFDFIDGKIASSSDLAFTYGRYTTINEPDGPESGYYVHVWRRDGSEKWKLVVDVQNPLPRSE